jgi:hypothetical protein
VHHGLAAAVGGEGVEELSTSLCRAAPLCVAAPWRGAVALSGSADMSGLLSTRSLSYATINSRAGFPEVI